MGCAPKVRFATDPALEEDGLEPPVPPGSNTSVSTGFASWRGGRSLFRKAPVLGGDRQFESVFLQRRVSLTGVFGGSRRKSPGFAGSVSLDVTRERDVLARSRL